MQMINEACEQDAAQSALVARADAQVLYSCRRARALTFLILTNTELVELCLRQSIDSTTLARETVFGAGAFLGRVASQGVKGGRMEIAQGWRLRAN